MTRTLLPFVDNNKHRSKTYFYALYMISKTYKTKSSSTCLYLCFPLRRAYLLLYVESVNLSPSILSKHLSWLWFNQLYISIVDHVFYSFLLSKLLVSNEFDFWSYQPIKRSVLWIKLNCSLFSDQGLRLPTPTTVFSMYFTLVFLYLLQVDLYKKVFNI